MANINPNEESSQSQCKQIAAWLRSGRSITWPESMELCGCQRLASRINDLKNQGMVINSERIVLPNGKRVAKYTLIKDNC